VIVPYRSERKGLDIFQQGQALKMIPVFLVPSEAREGLQEGQQQGL